MKVYLAGVYSSNFHQLGTLYQRLTEHEKQRRDTLLWHLESYHYINHNHTSRIRSLNKTVFLDSGAFSAFTKGIEVDLDKYVDFIKENLDVIEVVDGSLCASVLDGINDPKKTFENQAYMEKKGITPLPCFHYGEDERYLEFYVANYDYITLGGMVPIDKRVLIHWLDRIWERYLTDGAGYAKVRVHGFGMTTINLIERYPWFSVDSSTWVQFAANGNLSITDWKPGMILNLPISSLSPSAKKQGAHFNTVSQLERERLQAFLEGQGYEIKRLADNYYVRWVYNLDSYNKLNYTLANRHKEPFYAKKQELF